MFHRGDKSIDQVVDGLSSPQPPKLLDRVRHKIRFKHYSIRTEQAHVDWARRYILFYGKRHPADMGAAEMKAFF